MCLLDAIPKWLTDEKYLTSATWGLVIVTAALVIVTFILFLDSRSKGKEQRERWRREDESLEQDRKPKSYVELVATGTPAKVYLCCFNLGSSSFVIDEVLVRSGFSSHRFQLAGPLVVSPGKFCYVPYELQNLSRWIIDGRGFDAALTFLLHGSSGDVITTPVPFCVLPNAENGYVCRLGQLADRRPGTIPRLLREIDERLIATQGEGGLNA